MSKVSLIAKLTAVDGRSDELEAAIRAVVEASNEEPGLEVYSAHRLDGEPGTFYFFELYRDQEAWEAHGVGDQMRAAMAAFGGLLAEPPELITLTPLAAKGLAI